ncbi:DUF4174 domain-containing protein [Pokkaliibacter sp. CJK22405]|uniref:DUF4174 domain-containing protein n=1 Tax=Pokkaliibacter sp. CJK22405 TaxID=3384615 RepID=UPI00398524AC
MKTLPLTLALLAGTASTSGVAATLTDLTSLQWKNRIIVVDETANPDSAASVFERQQAEVQDRDVVWFVFQPEQTLTNYSGDLDPALLSNTRERYGLSPGKVLLIGKDGGVKNRLDALNLELLFNDIDRMPMRKYEKRDS